MTVDQLNQIQDKLMALNSATDQAHEEIMGIKGLLIEWAELMVNIVQELRDE